MSFAGIDLEDNIQEFVLDTKKIELAQYPEAFNPSVIRWKGKLLLSFRIIPNPILKYNSEIGVVWVDENFDPISEPQILDLTPAFAPKEVASRAEDARLIEIKGQLFIIYDDCRDYKLSKGGFRMYVAKLDEENGKFIASHIMPLTKFEGESKNLREKNWVPFDYQDDLHLAYSVVPHRIFRYVGKEACETICETKMDPQWEWGTLRGGTPALKIDNQFYLTFFHSSKTMKSLHSDNQDVLHYFIGAYTYSLDPPFEINLISPEPIVGKNFYHGPIYKPYWHPVRVVYAAGYVQNEKVFSVVYGRQDHEMWVATIDKKGLLNSLVPVNSKK